MPQTREIPYPKHCGCDDVVIQQEMKNGYWIDTGIRKISTLMTSPQELQGQSGSSDTHARKAPSDCERWSTCTACLSAEQEHADKIFVLDYDQVRQLVPYLETFPDELKEHEVRAIKLVKLIERGKLKLADLTPEQKDDIKRSEGNIHSRAGVRAHDFAEAILNGRRTLDSIPEEFQEHVGGYIEYCKALTPAGVTAMVERKVPLFYDTKSTGTLDYGFVTDERVVIADLKWGIGKLVKIVSNKQLGTYGLSVVREAEESGLYSFEPDTVIEIHVYQPRHRESHTLKPWILTLKDLEDFCKDIQESSDHVDAGEDLVFAPSDEACGWCKLRKLGCKAHADMMALRDLDMPEHNLSAEELLAGLPDEDDLAALDNVKPAAIKKMDVKDRLVARLEYTTNGKLDLLSDEMSLMLIDREDAIMGLIADAKERISARVLSGENIEGTKIVMSKDGDRKWKNEDEAEKFCVNQGLKQDERCIIKLKGPAAIEKIPAIAAKLHKKTGVARTKSRFSELIERAPGRKIVVLSKDSRPAVTSDMDDLPDESDDAGIDEDCG